MYENNDRGKIESVNSAIKVLEKVHTKTKEQDIINDVNIWINFLKQSRDAKMMSSITEGLTFIITSAVYVPDLVDNILEAASNQIVKYMIKEGLENAKKHYSNHRPV